MPLPPLLETERLLLRPVELDDAAALFAEYATDPEVAHFLTWRPHREVGEMSAYLQLCLAARAEGRACSYVLIRRGDGHPMGMLDLRQESPFRIGFGYVLGRAHWRQGYMSEALSAVIAWAATRQDIWRVWAFCDVDNIASARTMAKAGLAFEGLLRRWFLHPNIGPEPRDCRAYAWCRG